VNNLEDVEAKNYELEHHAATTEDSENSDHFDYDITLEDLDWYCADEYPSDDDFDWKFSDSDYWDSYSK